MSVSRTESTLMGSAAEAEKTEMVITKTDANIEHRTSNVQRPTNLDGIDGDETPPFLRRSMLDVRCSMFIFFPLVVRFVTKPRTKSTCTPHQSNHETTHTPAPAGHSRCDPARWCRVEARALTAGKRRPGRR